MSMLSIWIGLSTLLGLPTVELKILLSDEEELQLLLFLEAALILLSSNESIKSHQWTGALVYFAMSFNMGSRDLTSISAASPCRSYGGTDDYRRTRGKIQLKTLGAIQ
ncbi:hypothetical protein Dimus_033490 [Dionaea muscipula]